MGFLEGSPAKEESCILPSLLFSLTWTLAFSVYLLRQPISLHTNLCVYSKHWKLIVVVITHCSYKNPNLPGSAADLGSFCPLVPAGRLVQEGRCRQCVSCAYPEHSAYCSFHQMRKIPVCQQNVFFKANGGNRNFVA